MKQSYQPALIRLLKTRSFKLAIVFLVFCSLVVALVFYFIFHEYPEKLSNDYVVSLKAGINTELSGLEKNCQAVAAAPEVVKAVDKENITSLSSLLPLQLNKYNIGVMSALNKEGVVLVRTKTTSRTGDNFFINAPLGRAMSNSNAPVASTEENSGDSSQLMLQSGCSVYKNKTVVGHLTANYYTDNLFVNNFSEKYLASNIPVSFYTKSNGIYGSNFSKKDDERLFVSYFYPESPWIKDGLDNTFVRIADGRLFLVRNIVLPGLESSVGGVLIFVPLNNAVLWGILGTVLPVLLFLFVLFVLHNRFSNKEKGNLWCCPFILVFSACYLVIVIVLFAGFFGQYPLLKSRTYQLYNSTLSFQPNSGIFDRHFSQRVTAVINTGSENINAIRLSISYNPKEVEVESVGIERSICEHFISLDHNIETGKIMAECIIPNPGFKGNSGVIADLSVKAKEGVDTATIRFLDDTEVLANDGLATSVLRLANDTTLRFEDSAGDKTAVIFSPSHPNPERWYSNNKVDLSWAPKVNGVVTIKEVSSNNSSLITIPTSFPPIRKYFLGDGVYRFTVNTKTITGLSSLGETIVRVDTTPPDVVELKVSENKIKPGGIVRFQARGHDNLSGLQRVFYLKINDEIFFPIGNEVYAPLQQAGNYDVTLRAYDKAGNYKDVTQKITVSNFQ